MQTLFRTGKREDPRFKSSARKSQSIEEMRADNVEDMADLAEKSGFGNVTMNLKNLAARRKSKVTASRLIGGHAR